MSGTVARVRDLRFRAGDRGPVALDGVDLDVRAGEVVVLRGPSGAGKTTVLRAMAGLLTEFHGGRLAGTVEVCGTDAARSPAARVARLAALAFQDPEAQAVMSTVGRDVAFGPESLGVPPGEIDGRVGWALGQAGAAHLAARGVTTLSGGERQRAALAAVLAMRTPLLLLDEPTSQMDDDGARAVLGRVRRLADDHGVGVVVSEHRDDRARAVADRIVGLAAPAPPAPEPASGTRAAAGPARAALVGVTAGHGATPVLRAADLTLFGGQVTALTGPNGSGKTTLLRILAGLHDPAGGRVLLGGADVAGVPPERRFPRIGLVPQAPGRFLLCETVEDEVGYALRNLGVAGRERRARVAGSLDDHGIAHLARRHPLDLSVGERERVAIAATAAARPDVLALDEPTRGLDPGARGLLGTLVRRAAADGAAVVVATHDPGFVAAWCDRVVRLEGGVLVEGPAPGRVP